MKTGKVSAARKHLGFWFLLLPLLLALRGTAFAQTDVTVYDEGLALGWQNWSWAQVDLASGANANTGAVSAAVTATGAFQAFYLRYWTPDPSIAFDTHGYLNLTFYVHGGTTGGQTIQVNAVVNDVTQPGVIVRPSPRPARGRGSRCRCVARRRKPHRLQWLLVPGSLRRPCANLLYRHCHAGIRRSAHPAAAGQRHGHLPGFARQRLEQLELGRSRHREHGDDTHGLQLDRRHGRGLRGSVSAAQRLPTEAFESLKFWIHGGAGGQTLNVQALRNFNAQPAVRIGPLPAGTWQEYVIPLSQLGVANVTDMTGVWFQENAGTTQPTFYVDDIHLEFAPPPSVVSVTVNPDQRIRTVDRRMFGLNAAVWDGAYASPNTQQLLTELNNQALRFPGGSLSDEYHWQTNMSEGQTFQWATSFDEFAEIAAATRAQVYITANYGTGTPQEAAEWVRYSNIVKGYKVWYWEIGNENYGSWEADNNTRPHDPVTYANRFKEYWLQMKAVDPPIKIGAVMVLGEDSFANYTDQQVTNPRTGEVHRGWTPIMLDTLRQLGITPDFVIYHRYEQGPGGESDLFLLNSASSWANDAAAIRQMVNDYSGPKAHRVELAVTEHNSVFSNPGKQTTSLVNGLFYADALGNLLKTEFNALLWWDLRNGQEGGQQQQLHPVRLASLRRLRHRECCRSRGSCRPVSDVLRQQTTQALCSRCSRPWCRQAVITAASASTRCAAPTTRCASWSSTSIRQRR